MVFVRVSEGPLFLAYTETTSTLAPGVTVKLGMVTVLCPAVAVKFVPPS
jgi:hypothetical protein